MAHDLSRFASSGFPAEGGNHGRLGAHRKEEEGNRTPVAREVRQAKRDTPHLKERRFRTAVGKVALDSARRTKRPFSPGSE